MNTTVVFEITNSQESDFVAASALSEFAAGSTCTCTCTCCSGDEVAQ
jgi:hypothetical protein